MTMPTVKGVELHAPRYPWVDAGFRVFFPAAALFAILTIVAWAAAYNFGHMPTLRGLTPFQWHAHEMLYGYVAAVVAGFMLTAIERWTGVPRLRGVALLILLLPWCTARTAMLLGTESIWLAGVADILFLLALIAVIAHAVIRSRQYKQAGVLGKLVALGAGQACFYAGVWSGRQDLVHLGVYAALYVMIGLILEVARRVLPGFIQNALKLETRPTNPRWLDLASLLLFVVFFVAELFLPYPKLTAALALGLFAVHTLRLACWHRPGVWTKPLLWGLYLAIVWIALAFALHALARLGKCSPYLAVHAFAFGGIGLATLAMMCRVTLGHTGRNIHAPPAITGPALACLALGAVVRVGLPWLAPQHHLAWIVIAQVCWVLGFGVFLLVFGPMCVRAPAATTFDAHRRSRTSTISLS